MPIIASADTTYTREIIPADTYVARCVEMVQIGRVTTNYQGQVKEQPKVRLTWELPDHLVEYKGEKQPARIGEEYTLTLDERGNLRPMLEGWRGAQFTEEQAKGFDVTVLVGVPCLLGITHGKSKDGKTYANISTVSKLLKNMVCPDQYHPSRIVEYGNWDWDAYDALPDFVKKKMQETPEFKTLTRPADKPAPVSASHPAPGAAPTPEQAKVLAPVNDEELPF